VVGTAERDGSRFEDNIGLRVVSCNARVFRKTVMARDTDRAAGRAALDLDDRAVSSEI